RGLLTSAAAFLALLLVATVVSSVLAIREHDAWLVAQRNSERELEARQETEVQRDAAVKANQELLAAQDRLQATLYAARINAMADAWATGTPWRVRELLAETRLPAGEKDLRTFERDYWHRQLHGELRELRMPLMAGPAQPVLSTSGNRMAGLMLGA